MSTSSPTPAIEASTKRKNSAKEDQTPKRQATEAAALPPPLVAFPPPLLQYPNGQFVSVVHHPHHQQPYYMYYPISPPFLSPTISAQQEASSTVKKSTTTTPRILPKNPESPGMYPLPPQQHQQSPMSPFYHHPSYSLQMSPTLMPAPYFSGRQESISSSPGLGPSAAAAVTTTTTADQREKARKVSHSAIERRRRERINDKILQLKQLIPSCVEQDNLHKMSILQSAIDYISYLKEIVKKLDETSGNGDALVKGDHLKVKIQKSMLPKEVEPFTHQFSMHQTTTATDQERRRSIDPVIVEQQKGLKPMDVIKSGTPIISTGTTPLTPPQELQQDDTATTDANFETTIRRTSAITTSDETKHMSLRNILC